MLKSNLLDSEIKYLQCPSPPQSLTPKVNATLGATNLELVRHKGVGLLAFSVTAETYSSQVSKTKTVTELFKNCIRTNFKTLHFLSKYTVAVKQLSRHGAPGVLRNAHFAGEQHICWKDAAGSCRSRLPRCLPHCDRALCSFSANSLQIPTAPKTSRQAQFLR